MTPIYGFDLSSRKIAMVALDYVQRAEVVEVAKRPSRAVELHRLDHDLLEVWADYTPGYVYIEAPVVGRGGARPTILQSQVDSIIQITSLQLGHLGVYSVNNKTWKKAVVGNGNAKKDDTAAWLAAAHPSLRRLCGDDQDLMDAAGVALYGSEVIARSEKHFA